MNRRLVAVFALTSVAAVAHAETKKAPEPREVVSTTAVELSTVPAFEMPAMLKDATQPPSGSEPTGILIGNAPGDVEKWRKNPITATSFLLKGENAAFAIQLTAPQNVVARDTLWISCDARAARRFQAIRWETFVVDATGNATWTIHDGFFDPKACRVIDQRSAVVHPRAVASFGERAIAFAARSDEGVTFLLPSTDAIAGDGSPALARVVRGNLPRVTVPVAKGASASAVAFVDVGRLVTWLAAIGSKDDEMKQRAPRGVTVRIDATQTVSEDAPTVIVRTAATP